MPSDMLVKLYELQVDWSCVAGQEKLGVVIRKPIGPEMRLLVDWVGKVFSVGWGSEVAMALANKPVSCFVAVREGKPIGFAAYDATVLGFLGPMGVEKSGQGQGTGKALLLAALIDMKLKGYGYAIIGAAGPLEFYKKTVGAVEIPGSHPGVYKTQMKYSCLVKK